MTGERLIKEYRLGEATVCLLSLRELSERNVEEMYALCGGERREKADKITSVSKKRQSVGAGYLLYLLQKKLQIYETPVILSGGKPVFVENKDVHFNLSHSGDYVALAYGDAPLGVDIERVARADLKIAKRFFAKEEYEHLAEREEEEQADLFARIWTAKEAVVKASGKGLSIPLERFSVLGETVDCLGDRYRLSQKKICEQGETLWLSVAWMTGGM